MNAFIVPGVPKLEKRTFRSDVAAVKAAKKFNVSEIQFVELVPSVKEVINVSTFKSKKDLWMEKVAANKLKREENRVKKANERAQKKQAREENRVKKANERELQRKQKAAAKQIINDTSKASKKSSSKPSPAAPTPKSEVKLTPTPKLSFGARMAAIKAAKAVASKEFNG